MNSYKILAVALFLLILSTCQRNAAEPAAPLETSAETTAAKQLKPTNPPATPTSMPTPTKSVENSPTETPDNTQDNEQSEEVEPSETAVMVQENEVTEDEEFSTAPELDQEPAVENLSFAGVDDFSISGTLFKPGGNGPFPGIILLHMLGSDRQAWVDNGFAQALADQGYVVLAVDMRGHGETGGSIDWTLAGEDIPLIWQAFTAMERVDPQETAVIGASIGANLALIAGANIPEIKSVVLLSPGLDYRGVTTEDRIELYGTRPVLIVASEEDGYAANSSRTLADLAKGTVILEMYSGAGHGTRMFSAEPDLASLIQNWLENHLASND